MATRLHGKDLTVVNVDDSGGTPVLLKAETISIGEEVGVDTHDTTTIGDQWHEFTTGLTPNSAPVGIAAGPDANLWFTENANPGRIGKIGAGCVPAPAPVETQPRFTG